jgi:hypothetical protein
LNAEAGAFMRKQEKKKLEAVYALLQDAEKQIEESISAGDYQQAQTLLVQCQEAAITMGNAIEASEGENCAAIPVLEDYCEAVFALYRRLEETQNTDIGRDMETAPNMSALLKQIQMLLDAAGVHLQKDIIPQKEIVFLPYKASMWDCLESVWRKECEDSKNAVYVIPIPYFDKDKDGKVYAMHYEGEDFPTDVPVTSYLEYSLEENHPDMIFIHNPYDEHNLITTVHPDFYSTKLKNYTDQLIYIPYFVLAEINPEDKRAVQGMAHFATLPGVVNATRVIVQSENMKQAYVEALCEWAGPESRPVWEEKIRGLGSPKFDKILNSHPEDFTLPDAWKSVIYKTDGTRKAVILYNNSVGAFLAHREQMLEKLRRVLHIFYENREETALLWRPHPLMEPTIKASAPELLEPYQEIIAEYQKQGFGIFDASPDLDRAVILSDAYYGDPSSVVELFKVLGKPVMIQAVEL